MDTSIQIGFKPTDNIFEKVDRQCDNFLKINGFSDDVVQTQINILNELVKNGIKYGNFVSPDDEIKVLIQLDKTTVTVEVDNPVDDSARNHLKKLDKTIQLIRGYQDTFEAYLVKLREACRCPGVNNNIGLGLVSIAFKEGAILDFLVTEENILKVSAISSFKNGFNPRCTT